MLHIARHLLFQASAAPALQALEPVPPPTTDAVATSLASLAEPVRALASGPDLTRYFLVCTLLLVAIGALAWGVRRMMASGVRFGGARRSLRIVELLQLGGKRSMAVVQCYDRTFLLALGEKDVSLVTELAFETEPASAVPEREFAPTPGRRHESSKTRPAAPLPAAGAKAEAGTRSGATSKQTFGAALESALASGPDRGSRASRAAGILRALRRGEGVLG